MRAWRRLPQRDERAQRDGRRAAAERAQRDGLRR